MEKNILTSDKKNSLIKNEALELEEEDWSDASEEEKHSSRLFWGVKDKKFVAKIKDPLYNKVMSQDFGLEDLKMVFIVRQDLKMGAGKIGAQCGHATLGVYEKTKLWAKFSSYWNKVLS